jgi:hypothetical protein
LKKFFEGGGSLEEYCARMTTGYLSQHYLLNPNVIDKKKYIKLSTDKLGFKIDANHVQNLQNYISHIEMQFE